MKVLRQNISAHLKANCPSVKYINTWNNQVAKIREQEENQSVAFRMPAVFVEILDNEIHNLGMGNQIYDPLDIRFHVVCREDKSINLDENLTFEDARQEVYAAIHKWFAPGTPGFFRINEGRDYDHDNVYHCWIDFRTSYVDNSLNEPRKGVLLNPPFTVQVDTTIAHNITEL